MRDSEINLKIKLDDQGVPEKIDWMATDNPDGEGFTDTRAVNVAIWDTKVQNTLRLDLWTKEMTVDEMKKFYIDCLGGMSQSLLNATGDSFMSEELKLLADKLFEHVKREMNKEG